MMIKLTRLSTGGILDKVPESKKCCDCGVIKQLKDFKKNDKMKDGRLNRCNVCENHRLEVCDSKKEEYSKIFFIHTQAV